MIRSFFKLSIRSLFFKNLLYTGINIAGLAVGFASVLLVSLFIHNEYSFDRYHQKADRIYRIILDFSSDGNVTHWAKTSAPIGQHLAGAYSEIEQVMRLRKNPGTDLLTIDDVKFYEESVFFAENPVFNIFDIGLKQGDVNNVLVDKNSIVISETLANKYFGSQSPIGKSLRLNNEVDLKVTGIMTEMPSNSHFIADAFISFSTLDDLFGEKRLAHWGQFDHYTYALLADGVLPATVEAKFPELLKQYAPEWVGEKETLYLQPITDIHLRSDRKDEVSPNSSESYSYVLGTIAVFILIMACANFVNLSTATQLSRTKEIAVQKILGANNWDLLIYYCVESIVICVFSLVAGFLLSAVALPYFNSASGKDISLLSNLWIIAPAFAVTVVIGLLSSILPSIQAMKSSLVARTNTPANMLGKSTLRNVVTTSQFIISIFLIIATLVVSAQFDYLKSFRMGFDSDQVIIIPIKDRSQNNRHAVLVNEITRLEGVNKTSISSSTPGSNNSLTYTYSFGGTDIQDRSLATFIVDENFIDLYGIALHSGRFLQVNSNDSLSDVVINKAAVEQLGLTDPIGKLVSGKVKGRVVGVVENFNHTSLHSNIEPVIMYPYLPTFRFVSVSLQGGAVMAGIKGLEKLWPEMYPGYPLEFAFLDDQNKQLYSAENQLSQAYSFFSIIAIIIASIGLIGLTTYMINHKKKEISIRKVFGSSTFDLIKLIYASYAKMILVSVVVAWCGGYYWLTQWLNNFAFKVALSTFYFAIPVIVMVAVLALSTGFQTYKAAQSNPVDNLRDQ